jgi:hypothetical protein
MHNAPKMNLTAKVLKEATYAIQHIVFFLHLLMNNNHLHFLSPNSSLEGNLGVLGNHHMIG